MASVTGTPIPMRDSVLKIGTDNYELLVSAAELVPTTSVSTFKGLKPTAVFPVVGTPEWTLNITFAQDHETTNSLSRFTFDNVGAVKTFELRPVTGGTGYTGSIVIVPTSVGGAQGSDALTAQASFSVVGQPTRVTASA